MTIRNIDKLIGLVGHPLESHFDLPAKSTEVVVTKRTTVPLPYELYDEKDKEIEEDYQLIADAALDVADLLKTHIDGSGIEPKFIPRLAEVLGQQLGLALSAVDKKAKMKDNKDKFEFRKSIPVKGNVTNNNTIIMNRNDVLRAFMHKADDLDTNTTVDAEYVSVEEGLILEEEFMIPPDISDDDEFMIPPDIGGDDDDDNDDIINGKE